MSESKINNLPYRPGVGMLVLNEHNHVFVGKRIDSTSEAWQMPQGGIDENEDPRIAALRELKEEIGTDKVEIVKESNGWLHYDLPEEIIPKVWGGKFRGQRQKWFVIRFTGNDEDINVNTAEPEFSEWLWAQPSKLPDLIVPFKRDLYQNILKEFGHLFSENND